MVLMNLVYTMDRLPVKLPRKMVASIGPGKAYVKGYEIVNKETKYLEINKARESLSTDNVTLKTRGSHLSMLLMYMVVFL